MVLAADTAASAIRSNFRIEQDNLVRAVGAVPERLHNPASALEDVTRAWLRAKIERRPVVLMLPLDVQAAPLPDTVRHRIGHQPEYAWVENMPPYLSLTRPSDQAIIGTGNLLAWAHRPLSRRSRLSTNGNSSWFRTRKSPRASPNTKWLIACRRRHPS